ncbi:MAG TPA: DUF3084 domain-containing protein [Trichocoleus sp.]
MVSGYILIVAVLLLGGVIATLGDRIGTRVGKARLSLFNLRPRQTATLVSIATGSIISTSTLAILFAVSSQLRKGVFELGEIQADLSSTQDELAAAKTERDEVKQELASSTKERERARQRLQEINRSREAALKQQQATQAQLQQTRDQLTLVSQQATGLRSEIERLQTERQSLRRQRDQDIAARNQATRARDVAIADRNRAITERNQAIAQGEQRLAQLETQQAFLSQQIATLERQYEGLFRGNIALGRNQELVSGLIKVSNPNEARQVITRLLYETNRTALQRIAPGTAPDHQIILIENREVEQIIAQISDGQEYVIRILSAANYVIGEPCVLQEQAPCVQVFFDAAPNRLVYEVGERLASTSLETAGVTDRELVERLNLLIAATQFRARQDGIVGDAVQIADNRTETLLAFLEKVKADDRPLEIQAIAANPIFAIGPIRIELMAVRDGNILFQTSRPTAGVPTPEQERF